MAATRLRRFSVSDARFHATTLSPCTSPLPFPAAFPNGLALSWLHLPLTLTAALLVLLLVRTVPYSLSRRLLLCAPKGGIAVPVEKPAANANLEKSSKPSPSSSGPWFSLNLGLGFISWETLPTIIAESLPITLHPPPARAMRGRHVYRGGRGVGFVHPSTSNTRTQRPMVEAPRTSLLPLTLTAALLVLLLVRTVPYSLSRRLRLCAPKGGIAVPVEKPAANADLEKSRVEAIDPAGFCAHVLMPAAA